MLDNASGSVTILDIAQMMRRSHPRNKLRFIWFGGEELGPARARTTTSTTSSPDELSQDRVRPRRRRHGDTELRHRHPRSGGAGPLRPHGQHEVPGQRLRAVDRSRATRRSKYFDSIGKNHILFSPVGTDAFSFNLAGIPASGVLTGQDCCKTQEEVDLFGGYPGTTRATCRAPTAAASTTRSGGATTSATTTRAC